MNRAALVLATLGTSAAVGIPVALAASGSIKVGDNYFVRPGGTPTTTAKSGGTLSFKWTGRAPHNVTVLSGPTKFNSKTQASGSYKTPKLKKGTYVLYCTIHSDGKTGQRIKVTVK